VSGTGPTPFAFGNMDSIAYSGRIVPIRLKSRHVDDSQQAHGIGQSCYASKQSWSGRANAILFWKLVSATARLRAHGGAGVIL